MSVINEVIVVTTYTRPNTSFEWHEQNITDPALSALQQEVVAMGWANYVGQKSVQRRHIGDLTLVTKWTWFKEETYDEYMALAKVQQYQAALKAYYEANGGEVVIDTQIIPSPFLN